MSPTQDSVCLSLFPVSQSVPKDVLNTFNILYFEIVGFFTFRVYLTNNNRVRTTTLSWFFQEPSRASSTSPCRTSRGAGTCRAQLAARPKGSSPEWGKALWGSSPSPSEEQLNWCPRLDTVSPARSDNSIMFLLFCPSLGCFRSCAVLILFFFSFFWV